MLQSSRALVTIGAINFEEVVLFYHQLLGQEPVVYLPQVYAEFQIIGLHLGIFCPRETDESEFEQQGKNGMSLCIEVMNLEAAIAHLTNLGYAPPGKIITASHGREIYTYDPAHNRIILYQQERIEYYSS